MIVVVVVVMMIVIVVGRLAFRRRTNGKLLRRIGVIMVSP